MATATDATANLQAEEFNPNDVIIEPETYTVLEEIVESKDKDGNVTKKKQYAAYPEKEAEKRIADGSGTKVFDQTLGFPKAKSITGLQILFKDADDELINMANRGTKVKLQNRGRATLVEVNDEGELVFEPVAGTFSLIDEVASPTQRRGLTPLEKVERLLKDVSPEQRDMVIAALKAAKQG